MDGQSQLNLKLCFVFQRLLLGEVEYILFGHVVINDGNTTTIPCKDKIGAIEVVQPTSFLSIQFCLLP